MSPTTLKATPKAALVVADRLGAELAPLTAHIATALLPVGGMPMLWQTLAALARLGVHEVLVLLAAFPEQARAALGDGTPLGLRITWALTRGEEHPASVLGRLSHFGRRPDGACLALRGDVVLGFDLATWLAAVAVTAGDAWASVDGHSAGFGLHHFGATDDALDALAWPPPPARPAPGVRWLAVPAGQVASVRSLVDYHAVNMAALGGALPGLRRPGRSLAPGLVVGAGASVSPRSVRGGPCQIGARCRLAGDVRLQGPVLLCDDVIVGAGARIEDSLILPHTYIGPKVAVTHAILRGNTLIRVDTGAVLRVTDQALLADRAEPDQAGGPAGWLHQAAGLLALGLSAPLWPLALLVTAWHRIRAPLPGPPLEPAPVAGWLWAAEIAGNRREPDATGTPRRRPVTAWHWHTPVPVLRALPWLLLVVRGDLRLVGVSPMSPALLTTLAEDWELLRERAPVGLAGPTQLLLPADAPLEERLLSDAFYARRRTPWRDLGWLLRGLAWLVSARAWRAVPLVADGSGSDG